MPQDLWELYTSSECCRAVHFRKRCRTYNNTTAFSSLGITYDETLAKSNKGIYTLRIQGAVYHFIRDLMPVEGHGRQLQLYFYDPENELQNRLSQSAAIWNEITDVPVAQPHDIRVYAFSGKTHCVHYYYGCYDQLQYLLLFPYGESGWHTGIRRVSLASVATHARSRQQCSRQEIVYPRSHHSGDSILAVELENLEAFEDMRRRYLNALALAMWRIYALILTNPNASKTQLTGFFSLNALSPIVAGMKLLYKDFPRFFVWDATKKFWHRRVRGICIGRLVSVSPLDGERYFLRLLLNHICAPTSFQYLRIYEGILYPTFRAAALARGLLNSDTAAENSLTEASSYQMLYSLRRLFATLLIYNTPYNPRALWDAFKMLMADDYIVLRKYTEQEAFLKTLQSIDNLLQSAGRTIDEFGMVDFIIGASKEQLQGQDFDQEQNYPVSDFDLNSITMLNSEQREAFKQIIQTLDGNHAATFFIDGPAGSGKTFLYRALLAAVRSKHFIALAVASSGVAASLLPGGRTAHSRFKLPIIVEDEACTISKQSVHARVIIAAKLIIWDEASMAHRKSIEAVDALLRDLMENDLPFGEIFAIELFSDFPVEAEVSIVNKTEPRTSPQSSSIRFQKLLLADNKENRVEGMVYRGDIDLLKNSLRLHQTYLISNAVVRPIKPRFENPLTNNKYQWILGARTTILATDEDAISSSELAPTFTQSDHFRDFLGTRTLISAAAIIIDGHAPRTVTAKGKQNTLHEYAAVDEQLRSFIITLWNDAAPDDVYNLLNSTKERHIIAALNFSVTDFHNISLSSTSASVVLINSSIERVPVIHKEKINVLQQQGDVFKRAQTNFSSDPDIFTSIQTLLTTEQPNRSDLLVRGKLARTNQNFIYPCCAKCHRLTTAAYGNLFECHSCNEIKSAIPRFRFSLLIYDDSGEIEVTVFGDEGEKIMQMSAPEFLNKYCNDDDPAHVPEISASSNPETAAAPSTAKEHPRSDTHPSSSSRGRASKAKKIE
ncbi:hypothetical protein OROMI_014727 [Orobanche minor]